MIAKKPQTKDAQAHKFIAANGAKRERGRPKGTGGLDLQPVYVNFDKHMLERVDNMAREMSLNRTAFIVSCVAEKLRALNG